MDQSTRPLLPVDWLAGGVLRKLGRDKNGKRTVTSKLAFNFRFSNWRSIGAGGKVMMMWKP